MQRGVFRFYDLGWDLAIPFLKFNNRLEEGFEQRRLIQLPDTPADLWIQAASAGEAYLAWELVKRLEPHEPIRILLTTNTSQGIGILNRAIDDITTNNRGVTAFSAYFPFDKPGIMRKAVNHIRPRAMVLLESELWPGLLAALKELGSKCIIVNGRITRKSLRRYGPIASLWPPIRPDAIMAISREDAQRFAILFRYNRVTTMPNMKFDRLGKAEDLDDISNHLRMIFPSNAPFIVLGSIRKQEESAVSKIIPAILHKIPHAIIGVFPRHLHRISRWESILRRLSVPWRLRSDENAPIPSGSVLLWDVFGELTNAYAIAKAAFVGGSLAPLGGQNFLEPLIYGVPPVIGPHWDNFTWVSPDIFGHRLVKQAFDWRQVAEALINDVQGSYDRDSFRKKAWSYIEERQGGSDRACQVICQYLKRGNQF